MSMLKIFQAAYKVGRQTSAKSEMLQIEKLIDPRVIGKVADKPLWEWRAQTDLGCARVPIFAFSKSVNDLPSTWYPVKDSEPLNTHMTDGELREAALMAVRGACYELSLFPETLKPIDALIMLLSLCQEEPDLIFADWLEKAIRTEEIYFFLREWEKDYEKSFMPRRNFPKFAV